MANLHKYTSTEALNISYASDFEVQSAWSITDSEGYKDITSYHTVMLQTDEDIYYGFSESTNFLISGDVN